MQPNPALTRPVFRSAAACVRVRRKCLAMVEDGWLERDGDAFRLGERVDSHAFTIYEENIERLMSTAKRLLEADRDEEV